MEEEVRVEEQKERETANKPAESTPGPRAVDTPVAEAPTGLGLLAPTDGPDLNTCLESSYSRY